MTGLRNKAYLILQDNAGQAIFEFEAGLEIEHSLEKNFLMGNRGQYIREFINLIPGTGDVTDAGDRRAGFWIDGGAGAWTIDVAFETGNEDVTWGDGDGGTGPTNVTERDATGAEVSPDARRDVFDYWMARARTDSLNPALLYAGEWSASDHSLSITTPDGAMGEGITAVVQSHQIGKTVEEPSSVTGNVTLQHANVFDPGDIPSWLDSGTTSTILANVSERLEAIANE